MQLHTIGPIVIGFLILYRIYLRVRRTIGWQPLIPKRMRVRIIFSLIFGLLFLSLGSLHPISLISDAVGILLGIVLAVYGAATTQVEQRDGRWQYRPNTWIGSLVTVLFLGRLLFRIYEIYTLSSQGGLQGGQNGQNGFASMGYDVNAPWSSGLLLIMFAYYVGYFLLLYRKHKHLPQTNNS